MGAKIDLRSRTGHDGGCFGPLTSSRPFTRLVPTTPVTKGKRHHEACFVTLLFTLRVSFPALDLLSFRIVFFSSRIFVFGCCGSHCPFERVPCTCRSGLMPTRYSRLLSFHSHHQPLGPHLPVSYGPVIFVHCLALRVPRASVLLNQLFFNQPSLYRYYHSSLLTGFFVRISGVDERQ